MKAGESASESDGQAHDSHQGGINGQHSQEGATKIHLPESEKVNKPDPLAEVATKVDAQLLEDWPFLDSYGRLPLSKKLLWALPYMGWYAVLFHKKTYMKLFYVDDYPKASLGYIALFSVLAVLIDAFTDPKMANYSDNARFKRLGRRRPFIFVGGIATVVVFTFGYWPLVPAGAGASIWFGVFHIATKLCETVAMIPMEAWGAELSPNYTDRTSIFMWQQVCGSIGLLLGTALPGFVSDFGGQDCTDGQPGCLGFPLLSFVFGSMFFVALVFLVILGRERPADRLPSPNVKAWSEDGVIPTLIMTWLNTPFRYLIVSAAVKAFGANLPFAVLPFMARGLLGDACLKPTRIISIVAAVYIVSRVIFLPIWLQIGHRVGKFKSFLAFLGCLGASQSLFVFLGRDTGDCLQLYLAAGLAAIWGAAYAGIFFLQSIMADVVDYDEFLTGKRRESQYMMIIEFLAKFVEVLSEAIPFLLLAHFGYKRPSDDDDIPDPEQPAAVVWTLRLSFSLVPGIFNLAGVLCLINYPRDARSAEAHARLVLAITENHRKGLAAEDPWFSGRIMPPPPPPSEQEGLLSHMFPSEIRKMVGKPDATEPSFAEVKQAMLSRVTLGLIVAVPGVVLVIIGWQDLDDDLGASVSPLGIILLGVSTLIIWFHLTRFQALQALERAAPTRRQLIDRFNYLCRFTREDELVCSLKTPNLNGLNEHPGCKGKVDIHLKDTHKPDVPALSTPPMPSTPKTPTDEADFRETSI